MEFIQFYIMTYINIQFQGRVGMVVGFKTKC
jgi:hypothetical protein